MNNLVRKLFTKIGPKQLASCGRLSTMTSKTADLYEPDYLELLNPEHPIHPMLNVEITGHDYPLVENFQKLAHKICELTDLNAVDGWGAPAQCLRIVNYKSQSEVKNAEYELKMYRRLIQIKDVPAYKIPTFLRLLDVAAPQGLTIQVVEHAEHYDEERYVPDSELIALKNQLEDISEARKK